MAERRRRAAHGARNRADEAGSWSRPRLDLPGAARAGVEAGSWPLLHAAAVCRWANGPTMSDDSACPLFLTGCLCGLVISCVYQRGAATGGLSGRHLARRARVRRAFLAPCCTRYTYTSQFASVQPTVPAQHLCWTPWRKAPSPAALQHPPLHSSSATVQTAHWTKPIVALRWTGRRRLRLTSRGARI